MRLPRTLVAVAVGLALGVAGALLQAAARNPLAEPGLLGVSAGRPSPWSSPWSSVLRRPPSVRMWRSWGRARGVCWRWPRPGCAGPGRSRAPRARRCGLQRADGRGLSVMLLVDARAADEIRFWTIGSVAGRELADLWAVVPVVGLGLLLAVLVARSLTALSLGDDVATGLGHRPGRVRALAVTSVALLVGGATALAGPVAFVGLVVPFAARALVGPDLRRLLAVSVFIGPATVLTADVVSRLVARPYEMPLGVMTALLGAPVLVAVVRSTGCPRCEDSPDPSGPATGTAAQARRAPRGVPAPGAWPSAPTPSWSRASRCWAPPPSWSC
ncbi:FecCD family ABC transporter permease [Streptomyces sp. INA 01156]